mmetsp:Transcript_28086/g.93282  ORF Transcript_28086/g.93282 Transcript_28086/m.93282 type:complete len:904 (+) Transcript_28086:58-2769(+)
MLAAPDAGPRPAADEGPPDAGAFAVDGAQAAAAVAGHGLGKTGSRKTHVVLRVVRAELVRSFRRLGGSMAPYAEISWLSDEGVQRSRSRPHRKGHMSPVWNYECLHMMSLDCVMDAGLEVKVFIKGLSSMGKGLPTLCGAAAVTLGTLLGACAGSGAAGEEQAGLVHELALEKKGVATGKIWVQAEVLHQHHTPSLEWMRSDLRLSRQLAELHACAVAEALACPDAAAIWPQRPSPCTVSLNSQMASDSMSRNQTSPNFGGDAALAEPKPSLEGQIKISRRKTRRRTLGKVTDATLSSGNNVPALLTSMHSEWSMASDWEGIPHCKTMRSVWSTRTKQTAQTAVREFTPTDLTFQLPVRRLGVSGGTAPFFGLQLSEPLAEGRSLEHYIGKDLSHARDEVSFYEQARSLLQGPAHARRGLQPLLSFLLDYAGVASCPVEGAHPNEAPNDLLVMRNMRDGCKKLRMLDIKIGEKTASAGWQGKSRMAALKQDCLDVLTNSKGEGFRLEGFDGPPPVLRSMDPLLDLLKLHAPKEDVKKKAFRFMLQRMPAAEVFMHLVDVHQEPRDMSEEDLETLRAPTEAAELVLHEICSRLAKLALACRQCPAPQKWVGSSVALGFEAGGLPGRKVPEAQVREQVRVNLFDWGRSELNTPESHAELEESEQQDRFTFWRYYVGGIDRLAWEASRCYRHRFGSANGWLKADIVVYDFDSMTDSDFIGQVSLTLRPTEETTAQLTDQEGWQVRGGWRGEPASLTYRIEWRNFPEGSRLRGAWRVTLRRAQHLPGLDHFLGRSTSDPFAVITAISQDGRFRFRQQTCVVERPAATAEGVAPLGALLPQEDGDDDQLDLAFGAWSQRLDAAACCVAQTTAAAAAAARKELAEWDQFSNTLPPHAPVGPARLRSKFC